VLALAGTASAQIATGNVYATVKDESGAALPGVNVELTGEVGTRTTVTGADGAFRFLNLSAGEYTVTLSLAGFAKTVRRIRVTTGENVDVGFTLKVSGVEETIEVTGETPLVDTKKRGTATTMTSAELADVPNARDPWAVLRAVPGVLVDRINIAGNENGQQANSSSKGSVSADQTWNLDGINVTDMSATGASPTYFDFGAFEEITVTTGGTDLKMQTGGSGVNLVTKRGTNKFHGSVRGFIAHNDLSFGNISDQNQSPYVPNQLAIDPRLRESDGSFRDQGDHIEQITEYGADLGGPILKDKLWFYATYGKQDIRLQRLAGTPDKTLLPSYNFKLNWQATSNTMVSAFYFLGSKQKFGRSPGTGLQEEDTFLWDQDNAFTDGGLPGGFWKLQVDQTFSPNFFMSFVGAYYDTGFGLAARGPEDKNGTYDYVRGVAAGTGTTYLAVRPQKMGQFDGSYFFQGLGGTNELKFGFNYRDLTTTSSTTWFGNDVYGAINAADDKVAYVYRDYAVRYGGKYISAYVGDMLSKDRFTLNVGVRYDHQSAKNLKSESFPNASFPNLMPAAVYDGGEDLNVWDTFSPRVGLSYALDDSRKTVLRASYARYYQQLSFGDVTRENPAGFSYLAFPWTDSNADGFTQPGEVDTSDLLYWSGVDPADPSKVSETVGKLDRNRKPKHDDEFILGIDHELGGSFAVGAAFTYRMADNWAYTPRLAAPCPSGENCRIIGPESYTQNAPVTANGYSAFTWSPNAALVAAGLGGRINTNRPGYGTKYMGFELTLNKRLANKWMGRIAASYNDWTYDIDTLVNGNGNPTRLQGDSLVDGDQVGFLSGGSGKGNIFYTSFKWQVYANALYQLPWGFDLSGAFFARQGSLQPIYIRTSAGSDGSVNAIATPRNDTQRYGNLYNFDMRLAKNFRFGSQGRLTLAAEWFNVFNNGLVLDIQRQTNTSAYNRINEVMSPSIFRFSGTLGF
jgi:hypothetical protein